MALVPYTFNNPFVANANGGFGDSLVSQLQAPYGYANKNNAIFGATRVAATVPVVAAALVSVFFLYNPVGSTVNMVLLDVVIEQALATTVVNAFGLYSGTTVETAAGTFTTPGTVFSRNINNIVGQGLYYSAYTHSGTPTLRALIGGHGAVTNATATNPRMIFDGKVSLPPGTGVSVAATTAAGTASGLTIGATWMEARFQ